MDVSATERLGIPPVWVLLLCLLCATVAIVRLSSWPQSGTRTPSHRSEPPVLPHWIPYLQHLPYFLWNPGALYKAGKRTFPNTPFTLVLNGTKFHVFDSPDTVKRVFSESRKLSFAPVIASMMENGMSLPIPDRPKFLSKDASPGEPKFVTENHNIWVQNLSGKALDDIMTIYMKNFRAVLAEQVAMHSTDVIRVNLFQFMRRLIFETSALTFFGPRLRDIWPSMWEDWRRYDDATYIGIRSNLAYYLQPGAHAAKEKMLKSFEKWIETAGEEDWSDTDGVWCERWGFKMNWQRDKLASKRGFTSRGRACLQASFLFVIVTNAAPMASWFMWCAAGTPERLALYRAAATQAKGTKSGDIDDGFPNLDMAAVRQSPYIHGLWLEALRLGTASAAARVVMQEDMELEGFLVQRGSVVLIPVQLMHLKEEVFQDANHVRPERWMRSDQDQLKRMNDHMRPFGGGTSICSGRHVAESEVTGVVTSLLLMFDVTFEMGLKEWEFNPRSLGVMAPKNDPVVNLQRKRDACGV